MSELSHQGAYRLIYQAQLNEAERNALHEHLRSCEECRQNATMFDVLQNHLVLGELPTRPSPQFTAVYREKAARRSRRSQIMKPVYAAGGLVALALIVLAGWFIVRATPETTTLEPVPVETAEIVAPAAMPTETAVPPTEEPPPTTAPTAIPPTEAPQSLYQTYDVGTDEWAATIADFNGDGLPDVGTVDSGLFTLLVNRGDGIFERGTQTTAGETPYGISPADLNGDSLADLAIAIVPEDEIGYLKVMLNNGDGTFGPAVDYPTSRDSWFPSAVDLDADGDLDLVIEISSEQPGIEDSGAGVWLNNGDGTFEDGERTYFGIPQVGNFVPADINGDAIPDLVVRNWPDPLISVLPGNGDGTFGERQDYDAEERNYDLIVSDLNNDDFPDVVTGNAFGMISVLFNDGNGGFGEKIDYEVGGEIWNIFALDMTGNGYADLVAGPTGSGMASLLTNDGQGAFELTNDFYYPGIWAESLDVADVDGDGNPDLIAFAEDALHVLPLEIPQQP